MNTKISQGIFAIAVIVAVMIKEGMALKCYECNSYENPNCNNPQDTMTEIIVDCPPEKEMCRKIEQDMNIDGDDIKRITRQCAALKSKGEEGEDCLERTGTYRFKSWYCECKGDLCNSATTTSGSLVLSVLVSSFFILRNML